MDKLFPNAKGLKTQAGAQRRLDGAAASMPLLQSKSAILVKDDGTFLPMIHLAHSETCWARHLCELGICVTN